MLIEEVMERLARSGVNVVLKVDEERMAEGGRPWTVVLSGHGLGEGVFIRFDGRDFHSSLRQVFAQLQSRPGDWGWLAKEGFPAK